MDRTFDISSLDSLAAFARQLVSILRPPGVLTLEGPLGVGKTALVREVVRALGRDPSQVTSPTFSLVNIYEGLPVLYHIDLYRIDRAEELKGIDIEEYLFDPKALAFIEWPRFIRRLLPPQTIELLLEWGSEETRWVKVRKEGTGL